MQMENIGRGANGDRVQGLDYRGCGFVLGDLPFSSSLLFPAVCRAPQVSAVPMTLSTCGHS